MALGGYRPVDLERPPFSLPPPALFEPLEEGNQNSQQQSQEGQRKGVQGFGLWPLPFEPGVLARLRSLGAAR